MIRLARQSLSWVLTPFLAAAAASVWTLVNPGPVVSGICAAAWLLTAFLLYFHRNPVRHPPDDAAAVVAGADGRVRRVEEVPDSRFPGGRALRISIFLSPLDVHVNRAPIGGILSRKRYVPGRHFFTILERSSEYNQHTELELRGDTQHCYVHQIAGPFVRRVVCWLEQGQSVERGGELGMMRFGSRLDIYLPVEAVVPQIRVGDRVRAGESVLARWKES